jgi:tRNA(Ile)-lysidine synthase
MTLFLQQLGQGIADCGLVGQRTLLAVSGGADSIALLRGMLAIQGESQIEIVVAHLDHGLRGEASSRDAAWLRSVCSDFNVQCAIGSFDIKAQADERGLGIEETARQVRYDFLQQTARSRQCSAIAVAHTADDQAETILHHIIRGTGMSGLRGIPMLRALAEDLILVRPMLHITRADVLKYLADINQTYREDDSNQDISFTRNRIRHELLPQIERNFNPRIRDALTRLGQQAMDIDVVLQSVVDEILETVLEEATADVCRIRCDGLAEHPPHLIRETLKRLWRRVGWPEQRMGFEEWNRLSDLVRDQGTATLPGSIEARRRGTLLILRR